MKPADPETQPLTRKAMHKGHTVPPGQPELKEAPLDEPYGKKSGSEPKRVPEEKSAGATPGGRR